MEYNPHRRLYNSTYSIALFIFGIILFWEVLGHNFFIFDDSAHIFENPLISSFSLKSLISLWKNSFIAMTYSLWGTISYFFGSKNTMAFHAVNIFFHCINSVLCFYLIKRVLEVYYGKNIQYLQEISFFSALIFLVHPLKVEPVVWVSALKDLLSSFFALSATLIYFKKNYTLKSQLLVIIFATLGIFSKQNIIILPFLFVFFDLIIFRIKLYDSFKKNIVIIVSGLIVGFYHLDIISHSFKFSSANMSGRLLLALDSINHYFLKFFIPYPLVFDYGKTIDHFIIRWHSELSTKIGVFLILMAIIGIFLMYYKNKRTNIFIGFMIFLILIFPSLGFVSYPFQNFSTVADRFFYLPSLGFSLILAFLFVDYKLNENKKFLTAFTIYLFLCTALSLVQIGYWKEPKYIIAKNLQVTPDSYALNISYGTIMKNEENYRKAAYHYSVALRLKPEMEEPRANLEMLLKKINRPDLIEKLKIQNFILDIKKELSKAF